MNDCTVLVPTRRPRGLYSLLAGMALGVALTACQTQQTRPPTDDPPEPQPPVPEHRAEQSQRADPAAAPETPIDAAEPEQAQAQESHRPQEPVESGLAEHRPPDAGDHRDRELERASAAPAATQAETGTGPATPAGSREEVETASSGRTTADAEQAGGVQAEAGTASASGSEVEEYRRALQAFDRRLSREEFNRPDDPPTTGGGAPRGGGTQAGRTGAGLPGDERPADAGTRASAGIGEPTRFDPPEDIPPAHDDDIVARQLREAAETESDPALRERLWDEYRAYKQAQE